MARDTPPLEGLDLNLLVTLRALLREASVSRAAERVGQTQPTVSRSLKSLRAVFHDPLLVRSGRGMALTPLATSLRTPLERVLGSLDRLGGLGAFDPQTDTRTFRIILPDLVAVLILPTLAARLGRDAPHVRLQVVGTERGALNALLNDDVDLLVGGSNVEGAGLYSRRLDEAPAWGVILGPHHPAFAEGALDLDTWLGSDHIQITPEGRPDDVGAVDKRLAAVGLKRKIKLQIGNIGALAGVLEAAPFVVTLPIPIANEVIRGRNLRVVSHPFADQMPGGSLRLIWHEAHHADPGDRWLRGQVATTQGEGTT